VNKFRGTNNGCFLTHEGANNSATALFSVEYLRLDEKYRSDSLNHPECKKTYN